jgi:hypothetical protein
VSRSEAAELKPKSFYSQRVSFIATICLVVATSHGTTERFLRRIRIPTAPEPVTPEMHQIFCFRSANGTNGPARRVTLLGVG